MTDPARDLDLAAAVRDAVLHALLDAWEDAGMRGLCAEGRFEAAVGALRSLDIAAMLAVLPGRGPPR